MTKFKLYINNTLINGSNGVDVKAGTLNLQYGQPGERSILNFSLRDLNPTGAKNLLNYDIGNLVELYDENDKLKFGGQFDSPNLNLINERPSFYQSISCVDWIYITDRNFANKSYPKLLISEIFKDIIDNFLASDGLTYDVSSIQETTNQYASINCSYAVITDVFNELASLINWQWKIGPDKKVYLFPINSNVGVSLIEHTTNYIPNSLQWKKDRNNYRNTQILTDVNALTVELTETALQSMDDNQSFNLRFPLNNKPKLYITNLISHINNPSDNEQVDPRQIGISGLDTNKQWYWSKGINTITKDETNTVLGKNQYLIVKYVGQYKTNIIQRNLTEIANRQSIEGGSGVYMHLESGSDIEDANVAANKAIALLNKYARMAQSISVESYTVEWEIGEIIDMIIPSINLSSLVSEGNGFLCISKQINDQGGILRKSYEFIDGNPVGGWVTYFSKWLQGGKNWTLRENALVEIPILDDEITNWGGSTAIKRLACLYPNSTLYPSSGSSETNIAASATITASCTLVDQGYMTDGNTATATFTELEVGLQWIKFDLSSNKYVTKVKIWHYYGNLRSYHDVILQVSTNNIDWTNKFNNDSDNSAGQGIGSDLEYEENSNGKEITINTSARYIRLWINGSTANEYNHYCEVEIYSTSNPLYPGTTIHSVTEVD
jgi:hypothetical protein